MMRTWLCQADVTLQIKPVDPVLVKSGYATVDGADMVPVCTFRNGESKATYYFPGTSLKGVLRSHLERIARTLQPQSVCIPYFDPDKSIPIPVASEAQSYGCGYLNPDVRTSTRYAESCAACRLFGSLKFGGRFSIGDAYPVDGHDPKIEQRNGVGIDRFTGGTVPGLLFDLQVLMGGVFHTQIRIVNFEIWQLAALYLLLTDLNDELIHIGSGRSRGLGRVKGNVTDFRVAYVRNLSQVAGLHQLASSEEEREAYGLHDWMPTVPIALPPPERRGLRHVYDLTAEWSNTLSGLAPSFESFLQSHRLPRRQTGAARQNARR